MRKPPTPKATPVKKVKKRNPWSDDESKSESDQENSKPVIPRETKSQRASGTVGPSGSQNVTRFAMTIVYEYYISGYLEGEGVK